MSTKDLVDALLSGDAKNIQKEFNTAIGEKVSERLDGMRQEVSSTMFSTPTAIAESDDVNQAIMTGKKRLTDRTKRFIDKEADAADRGEVNYIMKGLSKNLGYSPGLDAKQAIADQVAGPGNPNLKPNENTHEYVPFKKRPIRTSKPSLRGDVQFEEYSLQELKDFTTTEEFAALAEDTKKTFIALLES